MSSSSSTSSCRKRKWEEMQEMLGEHAASATAGAVAGHTISTMSATYRQLRSVDEQLEHLDWMVMEVGSVVAEAERVIFPLSWPLRLWLCNLRAAAREGRAVARSIRRQRGPESMGGTLVFLLRIAKKVLFGDEDMDRLRSALRKLEMARSGMDRFLKLLVLDLTKKKRSQQRTSLRSSTLQYEVFHVMK